VDVLSTYPENGGLVLELPKKNLKNLIKLNLWTSIPPNYLDNLKINIILATKIFTQ